LCALLLACGPGADPAAAGKSGYSSGRSYSSGSRGGGFSSRPSAGKSYSSGASRPSSRPAGKSYSSGSAGKSPGPTTTAGKSYSAGRSGGAVVPSRPAAPGGRKGGGFDQPAAQAQRKAESRRDYQMAQKPRPNWTDSGGKTQPIEPEDRRVEALRRQLNYERWVNRQAREREAFGPYYSRPPVVYHDPYSSFFWWWLLAQSLDQRAAWAYNHRADMDPQRYQDLLSKDRQLEARVRQLEQQKTPRDPTYSPTGLDPDLMYSDDYVDAVYNPQLDPAYFAKGLRVLFAGLAVVALLAFLIWLVFFKRWGASYD
jgi:hypothetical protein